MPTILYALVPFLSAIFTIMFGYIVFKANPRLDRNRAMSCMCIGIAIWLCCYSINYLSPHSVKLNIFLSRLSYVGVTMVWVGYLHFTVEFIQIKAKRLVIYAYIFGVVTVLLVFFTNLIVDGNYHYFFGPYPKAGKLHPFCLLYAGYIWLYCLFHLNIAYKNKEKKYSIAEAHRIRYVFWAYFIGNTAAIDYVQNYGFEFFTFVEIKITVMIGFLSFDIVKHQLLGIEVIIRKTLVFAGLLASVLALLILPTLLIQEYITRGISFAGKLAGLAISGSIIILFMRRIEAFLVNVTDKFLFQKKYDYKELLKTFTAEVLTILELDKLVNTTVTKLVDIVKLNSAAILLFDDEKQQFNVLASHNLKDPNVTLIRPDGVVTFMDETLGYILVKELKDEKVEIPDSVQEIIDKLNAELVIPMVLHEEVMGILSLGKKKSDEDYTQDDLDILLPLARTLAISVSNAQLFDQLGKTQAEAAQKEKMAVIGTLSAGINHEICNPLGIARGQCEAFLLNIQDGLYKEKSSDELLTRALEIMGKVIQQVDRATVITKKLSNFAKPAKGVAELVDISKEVDDVLGLVGYELKLEKIEIIKDIQTGLPDIFVDKKQIEEVLFNLIRNAGQAIVEKGKISIIARVSSGTVTIDIQDTGSGIPEDKIKQLFNPFFTTKDPGKGTGLGLFIVRQVVEKNGGRISLKSTKVGEGTTFRLEFPAAVTHDATNL